MQKKIGIKNHYINFDIRKVSLLPSLSQLLFRPALNKIKKRHNSVLGPKTFNPRTYLRIDLTASTTVMTEKSRKGDVDSFLACGTDTR